MKSFISISIGAAALLLGAPAFSQYSYSQGLQQNMQYQNNLYQQRQINNLQYQQRQIQQQNTYQQNQNLYNYQPQPYVQY